jgi:hypothetical protein
LTYRAQAGGYQPGSDRVEEDAAHAQSVIATLDITTTAPTISHRLVSSWRIVISERALRATWKLHLSGQ